MGYFDYYEVSPHHHVSVEDANRAVMIGEEVGRQLEKTLVRHHKPGQSQMPASVSVDLSGISGGLDNLCSTVQQGMGGVIDSIDRNTGEVTFRLDKISDGIESLHADFNWMMGDVIWKLELQNQTLSSILDVLRSPLDTQSKELRDRAEFAYLNGWYDEAVTDFVESEKKNYQDFTVHRSLGNIFLYHRPDLPRALECFRKAARYAAPRDAKQAAEAHLFAAYVCHRIGDKISEAVAECQNALRLNPNLLEANYCLAKYRALSGDGKGAVQALECAIRGDARYFEQSERDPDLQ